MIPVFVGTGLVVVVSAHWLVNPDTVERRVSATTELITVLGLLVSASFCLSTVASLDIGFEEPLRTVLQFGSMLVYPLDLRLLGVGCVMGTSPFVDYLLVSTYPAVVAVGFLIVGKIGVARFTRLCNTFSMFLHAAFVPHAFI